VESGLEMRTETEPLEMRLTGKETTDLEVVVVEEDVAVEALGAGVAASEEHEEDSEEVGEDLEADEEREEASEEDLEEGVVVKAAPKKFQLQE